VHDNSSRKSDGACYPTHSFWPNSSTMKRKKEMQEANQQRLVVIIKKGEHSLSTSCTTNTHPLSHHLATGIKAGTMCIAATIIDW